MDRGNNEYVTYRLAYWLKMANIDINFMGNTYNSIILRKAKNVSNSIKIYEEEIKFRLPNYNEIFQDFSTEKIYAIQSVLEKMFHMDEGQCLKLEEDLEMIEQNKID